MNALIPQRFEIDPSPMPLTIAMVRALDEAGLFPDDGSRHELIDGVVVMTPPPSGEHRKTERRSVHAIIQTLMRTGLDTHLALQTGGAFAIGAETLLGPDLLIIKDHDGVDTPTADDVIVLIEIANSSLPRDLGDKAHRYARAGVADYWVLDVKAKSVIVHRAPREGAYMSVQSFEMGQMVASLLEPALAVSVADLF
jgi:Uma2 family endonuclease